MTVFSANLDRCDACGALYSPGDDGATYADRDGLSVGLCSTCIHNHDVTNCSKCGLGWFTVPQLQDTQCEACRGKAPTPSFNGLSLRNVPYHEREASSTEDVTVLLDYIAHGLMQATGLQEREAACAALVKLHLVLDAQPSEPALTRITELSSLLEVTDRELQVCIGLTKEYRPDGSGSCRNVEIDLDGVELRVPVSPRTIWTSLCERRETLRNRMTLYIEELSRLLKGSRAQPES